MIMGLRVLQRMLLAGTCSFDTNGLLREHALWHLQAHQAWHTCNAAMCEIGVSLTHLRSLIPAACVEARNRSRLHTALQC